ncbi:MAG TPA: nitrate ABC transporter substrate-binding protein [Lachnospiraceae bacterium]|nr:nitrate ABC transporter substrate-binding protein [Lachnospiraceae bacterium]
MRIKKLTAIAVMMTALVLTACGGNKDNPPATGENKESEVSSDTAEKSAESKDITLVLDWTPNTNHTGIYVAKEKGYFEEAGLNVTVVQPPDSGATDMVASGQAQFGIEFQDTMAPALASDNPLPITAIAAVLQHNTSGLVSLKEKGIDSFGKLAGHSYATWDSPTEQAILKTLVEKDGGKWGDVKLISTYVEDIVAGLNADIDSVWIYAGWDKIKLEMEGIDHNFLLFKDSDPVFDYYSPVIVANNDFLSSDADTAKAFLAALKKGYEDAAADPAGAADILLKAAPELDEALVKKSQEYLSTQYVADAASWGVIDLKRWNSFYTWLNDNDLVEVKLPENAGVSTDYL